MKQAGYTLPHQLGLVHFVSLRSREQVNAPGMFV